MDRQYIQQHDIIERFVLNQLEDQELDAFLLYQMRHPEVQKEITAKREKIKAIRAAGRHGSGKSSLSKWLFFFLTLVVFTGMVWWWMQKTTPAADKGPIQETRESILPPKKKTDPSIIELDSNIQKEKRPLENKEGPIKNPPLKTKPKPEDEKPKPPPPNQPIAANFTPIQDLELMMDNTLRSEGYELTIDQPKVRDTLILSRNSGPQSTATLHFSGSFKDASSDILSESFKLSVFSNDLQDFQNFQPVHTFTLKLSEKDTGYLFSIKEKLDLNPGLYYWIIENETSGDLLTVRNFLALQGMK